MTLRTETFATTLNNRAAQATRILRQRQPTRIRSSRIVNDQLDDFIRQQVENQVRSILTAREEQNAKTNPSSRNGYDPRQLEMSIDQLVASSLLRGKQTSGVLRSLFGLVPSLIGR